MKASFSVVVSALISSQPEEETEIENVKQAALSSNDGYSGPLSDDGYSRELLKNIQAVFFAFGAFGSLFFFAFFGFPVRKNQSRNFKCSELHRQSPSDSSSFGIFGRFLKRGFKITTVRQNERQGQ